MFQDVSKILEKIYSRNPKRQLSRNATTICDPDILLCGGKRATRPRPATGQPVPGRIRPPVGHRRGRDRGPVGARRVRAHRSATPRRRRDRAAAHAPRRHAARAEGAGRAHADALGRALARPSPGHGLRADRQRAAVAHEAARARRLDQSREHEPRPRDHDAGDRRRAERTDARAASSRPASRSRRARPFRRRSTHAMCGAPTSSYAPRSTRTA